MATLNQELSRPMTKPEAKVVHLALVKLGPGNHTPAEICEVLGHPTKGRYLTQVIVGAKYLRAMGLVSTVSATAIAAGDEYRKAPVAKSKSQARRLAVQTGGPDA